MVCTSRGDIDVSVAILLDAVASKYSDFKSKILWPFLKVVTNVQKQAGTVFDLGFYNGHINLN